ncbi:MAG TPA: transketolase C-terminal domain-containing protein [Candidatus Acidoferrum sp.]|nr:transketolase C-terminal domain-containing protein [Candidatus Acidoferrum sp.]
MRNAFLNELFELAKQDERIVFITGDLGFGVVTPFMDQLPRQFLNAGVAEQNMTGIAAGMALSGKIAFTYSIGNFPTMRCLEHIRNDVCYHRANVKIVTVGGGFAYGAMGATHHAIEDLAVMRSLPGIAVLAPGDPLESRAATRAVVEYDGPCYLRLGKAGEPVVHQGPIHFQWGKAIKMREGRDVTLISTGGILQTAVRAARHLANEGIQARLLSMHTLKPLDTETVLAAALETGAVVTLEEHSILGGLGSAVAEVLAEADIPKLPFKRLGVPPEFSPYIGSQEYMQQRHGLTPEAVAKSIENVLQTSTTRAA